MSARGPPNPRQLTDVCKYWRVD